MKILKYRLHIKHDNGLVKITTSATSKEAAIEKVCAAEHCPPSAIKKCAIVTPTIYEIKRATEGTAPHYFTRSTMKFFRQTMKDFKVYAQPDERFLIQAPHRDRDGKITGHSERFYNPRTDTLELK